MKTDPFADDMDFSKLISHFPAKKEVERAKEHFLPQLNDNPLCIESLESLEKSMKEHLKRTPYFSIQQNNIDIPCN